MHRVLSVIGRSLVLVAACVAGTATARADAPPSSADSPRAQACVSDGARKLLACPGGAQLKPGQGKPPQMSLRTKVEDLRASHKPIAVGKADISMIEGRDPRLTAIKQRGLALLVTEIGQLESLLKSTAASSKDRPMLLRRLAEDYVELENAATREKTEAEIRRDGFKKSNPREAGKQQAVASSRKQTMEGARKAAIAYYTTLVTDYSAQPSPTFPSNPPPAYPLLDEVYYYLAYEYEQASDTANARRVYLDLITKTPSSKYIPNAYLAFGELFFNEALGDPTKWDPAKQAYRKVIARPPPENKVYGYAWYKLAYVFWNQGDLAHALDAFKKTIDFGTQFSQLPNASKLAERARRDVIPVYALVGNPTEAYGFLKNLSGDPAGKSDRTFAMMDDLGQSYLDTGHYPEAIALYRDLAVRDPASDRTCDYQSHITEATMAMKSGDKPAIVSELNNQFKRYAQYRSESHADDAKQRCANRTAAMATETAMAWHLEAIGSQGQRGTGDPRTMDLASLLYRKVAGTWDAATFSKFEFPRLVKEDWPTIYKIKYQVADLLYFRERWDECGPAFDAVVQEDPRGQDAADAAYAAALCYQNVYLRNHAAGADRRGSGSLPGVGHDIAADADERYRPKEMKADQKAMLGSFDRYVCIIQPDKSDTDGQKRHVEIEYERCRVYYEAQRWEAAAACFRQVAYDHADGESAPYAAQLYLESVYVLMKHGMPNRDSCIDDMIADVPRFLDMFCTGDRTARNEEVCTNLAKVQCDIQRLHAQKIVEDADRGGSDAIKLFEKGGRAYFELWEKYGATPLRENRPPQCEKLDEIVENAARAFQAAHLLASAIRARMVLLNPQFRMDRTELAKDAKLRIAGNWQAIAVYDQAADYYERYATQHAHRKTCVGGGACPADKALSDAVVLRLGLGQEDQAAADVKQYQRDYGSTNATEAAQIAFAIGAHDADKEDWESARKALAGAMRTLDQAPPDIQLQAHATYARALTHLHARQAASEYARVRALWGDGSDARAKIDAAYAGSSPDDLAHRLGKAIDAVGEAMFSAAEDRRRDRVDALPFPVYKGPGTKADVERYIERTMKPWVAKKRAAIEQVDREYGRITELQPAPPPRWVIASASRAGMMWGNFVDDFRKAPYPRDWDRPGFVPGTGDTLSWSELRANYIEGVAKASEPIKREKARPALERCLDDSVKYQYFDALSRTCEQWLAKNYRNDYHVVDELRGAPTLSNGGLDDRPPPLVTDRQLWHPVDTTATEKVQVVDSDATRARDAKKPTAGGRPKKK